MGKIRIIYDEVPNPIKDQEFLNFIINSGYCSTRTELFVIEDVKPTSSKEISDFFKTQRDGQKEESEIVEINPTQETNDFFTAQYKSQTSNIEESLVKKESEEKKSEKINHPLHYMSGNIEVIDIIADQCGVDGCQQFCIGNALKYICRKGKKTNDPIEDVQKAIWYLEHYVKLQEEKKEVF